jgi:hypothetical protein
VEADARDRDAVEALRGVKVRATTCDNDCVDDGDADARGGVVVAALGGAAERESTPDHDRVDAGDADARDSGDDEALKGAKVRDCEIACDNGRVDAEDGNHDTSAKTLCVASYV